MKMISIKKPELSFTTDELVITKAEPLLYQCETDGQHICDLITKDGIGIDFFPKCNHLTDADTYYIIEAFKRGYADLD